MAKTALRPVAHGDSASRVIGDPRPVDRIDSKMNGMLRPRRGRVVGGAHHTWT